MVLIICPLHLLGLCFRMYPQIIGLQPGLNNSVRRELQVVVVMEVIALMRL